MVKTQSFSAPECANTNDIHKIIRSMAANHGGKVSREFLKEVVGHPVPGLEEYCKRRGFTLVDRYDYKKDPQSYKEIDDAIDLFIKSKMKSTVIRMYIFILCTPAIAHGHRIFRNIYVIQKKNPDEQRNCREAYKTEALFTFNDALASHIGKIMKSKEEAERLRGKFIAYLTLKLRTETVMAAVNKELAGYNCDMTRPEMPIVRAHNELEIETEGNYTDEDLAEKVGCSVDKIRRYKDYAVAKNVDSLERIIEGDDSGDMTLSNTIADTRIEANPEEFLIKNENDQKFESTLRRTLSPFQYEVVCRRYGFTTGTPMNEAEVARDLDVYYNKVHRELNKAKEKLRENMECFLSA